MICRLKNLPVFCLALCAISFAPPSFSCGLTQLNAEVSAAQSANNGVHAIELCDASHGRINVHAFRTVRDRLWSGGSSRSELLEWDAEIGRAQTCMGMVSIGDRVIVSELMRLLAHNWAVQGDLSRADQLYANAYALIKNANNILEKLALLQDWSQIEIRLGKKEEAVGLARLQTELARKEFDAAPTSHFALDALVSALKFQADIFQATGHYREAQASQEEAQRVTATVPSCSGICQ